MTAWLIAGGALLAGAGAVCCLLWRRAVDATKTWQKQALSLTAQLAAFAAAAEEERTRLKETIHVLQIQVDGAQSGEAEMAKRHPALLAPEYLNDVFTRAKAANADPHPAVHGPPAPPVPGRSGDGGNR